MTPNNCYYSEMIMLYSVGGRILVISLLIINNYYIQLALFCHKVLGKTPVMVL